MKFITRVERGNQIVIPEPIATNLHLHPGVQVEWLVEKDRVTLLPISSVPRLRGLLKDQDVDFVEDLLNTRAIERLNER